MNQDYNQLLQGFIDKVALPERLKGTQYIKFLLTPSEDPVKVSNNNQDVVLLEMPYPTYQEVANKLNVPLRNFKVAVKYALSKLKWDKVMWQNAADYLGRIIEIDIHDGIFSGNADNFTWKWDSETFIAYIVDSLYHIHHGIMLKQDKGLVMLFDSKNGKYIDEVNDGFIQSLKECAAMTSVEWTTIEGDEGGNKD